jgi:hypothetical protein
MQTVTGLVDMGWRIAVMSSWIPKSRDLALTASTLLLEGGLTWLV